jgi:flavin-dependent dehydrogenase
VRGIGPLATTTTAQTFEGAALVGDACGYVDPVTGEGIYFALKGAEMLAQSLEWALHGNRRDRAALSGYLSGRRREIEPRARLGRLLQRGLRRPALVRAAFTLLEARPRVTDLIVSTTGDYVPLRELARPSVWLHALRPGGAAA